MSEEERQRRQLARALRLASASANFGEFSYGFALACLCRAWPRSTAPTWLVSSSAVILCYDNAAGELRG